jgi:sulfatase maturation enzyme AslB (radical SAM superfamily)
MLDREKVIKELENNTVATNKGYVEVPLILFANVLYMLKKQEAEKKCCRDCEYYGACHDE